ncbi:PLP-dependent aminotransferase family protein [Shewanella sp. VB17]|uniref:aminotransferase-like domain-containing protein n=1 Tax=Shewanella sp. VB17 TaxID=2739432 RepID=UPI001564B2AE|nr:PLP-dependent aminotransferase family protein [Shewanella sp. VB17]NRD73461.1 PLP-dependent aminotransferase family protein [Shewanella sp. VB17]
MTLYESLANEYIETIKAQRLPLGSRLPALRVLAKQHNVSLTTATRAYDFLMQHGWIYARPQAGYFVANTLEQDGLPQLTALQSESRDPKQYSPSLGYNASSEFFSPLGTSMIAPELQPTKALQRCIKRVTSRHHKSLFCYPDPQGEASLRQAIAEHFRTDHFAFSAKNLVITNGCIDAVRIAIETLTQVGDTIAISSPCFSGLLDLLVVLSRKIIEIPCSEDGVDLVFYERCLQESRIHASLFSTSHMNPSGCSLPIEQKQQLASLANQYQVPMIEDDVYIELSHQGKPPLPAKYWDKEGYIVWCGSFSKTLAAGLRLGWCLPGRYLADYIKQHAVTCFGVNGLMQLSLAEFIHSGEYRCHVNRIRQQLNLQIYAYRAFLMANLPADTRISLPEGGMVLWLQIPGIDAFKLETEANKQEVDIRSGISFSTHDAYLDCIRINCGWPLTYSDDKTSAYQQLIRLCWLIKTTG